MGKTKASKHDRHAKKDSTKLANGQARPKETPEQLYASALEHVEQSQPEQALRQAQKLWQQVQNRSVGEALPALNLLGEICVELGDAASARAYFEKAVDLDPDGKVPETQGGGAEKFLWLAQLCEEGGKQSVEWFSRGVRALRHEIAVLEETQSVPGLEDDGETALLVRVEKKRKLASALCAIVEVYMTDLSWEEDAEARCERLITEAMTVEDEASPEVLQTLASVRLSQERVADAQAALQRSLDAWRDLDPEDEGVPDFATRISLSRLLMEAGMEGAAMDVVERLVLEDDQSVEAWYLGGWCQYLLAQSGNDDANENDDSPDADLVQAWLKGSRHWLSVCLRIYNLLDYEDDRLRDHALELLQGMGGPEDDEEINAEAEEMGESEDDDQDQDQDERPSDEEMADS